MHGCKSHSRLKIAHRVYNRQEKEHPMASATELHQGGERSATEKLAWYTTALGLGLLAFGIFARSDGLAALGLAMTVGGVVLGNAPK